MSQADNTKQAAWVAIGSLFSFAVGIISPMVLSRYFSIGDYGTYKQVMYVYGTLLSVFTLGLPKAYSYYLPKRPNEESKAIINKITYLFLLLGAVFSLFLFLGAGVVADLLHNPELTIALRVFSPVPLFLLPTMGLEGIFATYKKTQFLALYTIITKILTILFTVIPVIIFKGNYIFAIIGFDIASVLTCLTALLLRSMPVKKYQSCPTSLTYKEIFRFSIPLLLASFWGMLYTSVNQFFVSRYYGNEAFAIFSNGFTELPFLGMIITSISTVLLPVFSRLDKGESVSDEIVSLWNSAVLKSSKLLFPMSIFCIFMARIVMICLYGDSYEGSTIYFQIKNIYGLFYVVPFAPLLIALGKTKLYSNVTMYFTMILIALEFLSVMVLDSPIYIAIASELCSIIKIIVFFVIIAKLSSKKVIDLLPYKKCIPVICASIVSSIPVFFVTNYLTWNKFVILFFDVFLFCVIYYMLCWFFKITYRDILASVVKNNKVTSYLLKIIP